MNEAKYLVTLLFGYHHNITHVKKAGSLPGSFFILLPEQHNLSKEAGILPGSFIIWL